MVEILKKLISLYVLVFFLGLCLVRLFFKSIAINWDIIVIISLANIILLQFVFSKSFRQK